MYEKFKFLLEKNNVTAYRVAQETGVSTSTLTQWKKGTYEPKMDKIKAISDYFKVPIEYFLE
ncbi:helix-turn-helix domain-containing protein [Lachnospiraceae bacterium LCP25S3_G4]